MNSTMQLHGANVSSIYSWQFSDLSADDLFKGLLAHGLFSDKLPPVFSSSDFCDFCVTKSPKYNQLVHSYVLFKNIKYTGNTRTFGIPTPFTYYELCKEIKESRGEFLRLFHDNTSFDKHKISRTHIRRLADSDKIFEMNYENYRTDGSPRFEMLFQSRYMLKTDIAHCFPSIYTHSIPWAFVGKEEAKKDKGLQLFYNRLDKCAQNTTYGETHGLLIGPHASNLLAETILTGIDRELSKNGCNFIRHIDDYSFFTNSEEEAERQLIYLDALLHQFGLSINRGKTHLSKLPLPDGEDWMRELLAYPLPKCPSKKPKDCPNGSTCKFYIDYKEINYFIDYVLRLIEKYNEDTRIFKYAIRMISGYQLTRAAKMALLSRLRSLCKTFPYLVPLLQEFVIEPHNLAPLDIKPIIDDLFEWAVGHRYYEAASFCLYIALENDFPLNSIELDFSENDDCVFLTLLFLYSQRRKLKASVAKHKAYAKTFLGHSDEDRRRFQEFWLYAYTVLNKTELQGHNEWSEIKNRNISFVSSEYK